MTCLQVVLGFPFISGAYATFVVNERQSKAKHLQTVAGVEPSAYWISTWLWDTLNYQIPLWITVALMFVFDVNSFITSERSTLSGVLLLMFFYGPAAAGYAYCVSFLFKSASLCNVLLIITSFLVAFGGSLASFIMTLIVESSESSGGKLALANTIVKWTLRFCPPFCLGKGLLHTIYIEFFALATEDLELTVWSEPILLYEVIFLALEGIGYTFLAIMLDRWSTNPAIMRFLTLRCFQAKERGPAVTLPEDDDVLKEQRRVDEGSAGSDLIVVSNLTKVFGNGKIAVNNMSLGIPAGECFGLLGINGTIEGCYFLDLTSISGAGKTTTMGMLTAEFPPSSGDATLAGISVTHEPQKIRRRIGYCPQFDAHFANLSGR